LLNNNNACFVLISCDERFVQDIIEEIKSIDSVTDTQHVQGIYDIVVKLDTSNDSLKEIVQTKIRYIDGIRSTLTLLGSS